MISLREVEEVISLITKPSLHALYVSEEKDILR